MTIRMEEADAVRDFARVMEHVRAGDEVRLQRDGREVAVVQMSSTRSYPEARRIDEVIAILSERERELGPLVMDDRFADDLEAAHRVWNQPLDTSSWD